MDFIDIKDGEISIDDSELGEDDLLKRFVTMFEKWGFDKKNMSSGVTVGPDFGYFPLADRFWRASLCIYFSGVCGCFWESGVGYAEPWLFNVRHSIELYLKGFLLYAIWLEELKDNHLSQGSKKQILNLNKDHGLADIYKKYDDKLKNLNSSWDKENLLQLPKLEKILLPTESKEILMEIDEFDKKSFKFRYPSLTAGKTKVANGKKKSIDHLQELDWKHDYTQILPLTGLPKKAGYFFDHLRVINSFHPLIKEIRLIESYLSANWDYISEYQDIEKMEYYQEYFPE
jgi:hypothetical protein